MEARVSVLEAANAKTQLLEAIQHLLEDKFVATDRCFDSIESHRESSTISDQICTHPSAEDDGDGGHRQGGVDHRERERASPLENHMPFIKMDFPRFNDGDDPIEWIYKAEQYFDYFSVMPEKKIKMVSFHLDREALQWFQWEDFVKVFCREFGSHGFEDFIEALFKLRQTGSLKDYIAEFRRLATRIHDLSAELLHWRITRDTQA